jgi:Spy/CpxP family protein refolding chaperone
MINRVVSTLTLLLMLLLPATALRAQAPNAEDVFKHVLVAPELIMKYHNEIGLEENQSRAIKELIQKSQSKFLDLQWEMQAEVEKLVKLLSARPTDENAVLAQVDHVLNLEREIKKAQVLLMVRIKNTLTPAQLDKLTELRRKPS